MPGITETQEFLDCLKTLGLCIAGAKKDGVVNWMDVPRFAPMLSKSRAALDKSDLINEELADLDEEELQEIVEYAFDALTTLARAVLD